MKFNQLGNTDIKVSEICLGTMTWGEQNTADEGYQQMDMAVDYGVNFFDVAEMYPVPPSPQTFGASETVMGEWFKKTGKRDQIIVASKVTGRGDRNRGMEHVRGGARLNAEHIIEACEGSLKRLQTDVIDLYQIHWPERITNFFGRLEYEVNEDDGIAIEETLKAAALLVEQGKVKYLGISNETPWGMMEYLRASRELDLPRVVSIQNPYNLLNRTFDIGLSEMSLREKVGLLAYSPLAFGVLTGKYLNGQKPENARLSRYDRFTRYAKINAEPAIEAYVKLAQDNELDPAQMALAWVNQRPALTSNIIGATSLEQLKLNLESSELKLSDDLLSEIDAIHARYPNPAP